MTLQEFEQTALEMPTALRACDWNVGTLRSIIAELASVWQLDRAVLHATGTVEWACRLFGIAETDLGLASNAVTSDAPEHIHRRMLRKVNVVTTLLELVFHEAYVPSLADALEMRLRLGQVLAVMSNATDLVRSTCRLMCSLTVDANAADPAVLANRFLHLIQDTKLTPLQSLLMDLSQALQRHGWRQHNGRYYVPITTRLATGLVVETHAWEERSTVEEMITSMCNIDIEHRRWCHLTSSQNMTQHAAKLLIDSGPFATAFPEIRFDRRLFAFTDGVYDASTDEWHPHGAGTLATDRVAIKYFEHSMGTELPPARTMGHDWVIHWPHAPVSAEFMADHSVDVAEGLVHLLRERRAQLARDLLPRGAAGTRGNSRPGFTRRGDAPLVVAVGPATTAAAEVTDDDQSALEDAARRFFELHTGGLRSVDHWIHAMLSTPHSPVAALVGVRAWRTVDVQTVVRGVWRQHDATRHLCYKTPRIDQVMFTQGYGLDDCSHMYAMIGRLMYEVGERDGWQVIPFLIGKAGTGKSVFTKLIRHIYPAHEVANLSSNGEVTFGLSGVYGKLLYLCAEVKKTFSLDQSEFQSMVSGEELVLNTKNQTARTVKWTAPGFLAGNEAFPFEDTQDSIFRRMEVRYFNNMVPKQAVQTRLFEEMISGPDPEFGQFLRKCNVAYQRLAIDVGDRGFWDPTLYESGILPGSLHVDRNKFRAEIDIVVAFLADTDEIHEHESRYMSIRSLQGAMSAWLKSSDNSGKNVPIGMQFRDKLNSLGYSTVARDTDMDLTGLVYMDPDPSGRGEGRDLVVGLYFRSPEHHRPAVPDPGAAGGSAAAAETVLDPGPSQ
jgi:hypothetical protein